ncbi:hypothetical protein FISHEDRAFT_36315 [Fistulina hepatica ATCC 64428]|uniref:CAP-Gly domain-containing protein n=1 Tax=Fistulina hepatica ATCC 64428 TaxID=1128425 RepID=A0A0D7AJH3_9AGAR|nr:hypothetical protein FISHEDRAFT_36315 [Fistulina hepatica ATCC 64428]
MAIINLFVVSPDTHSERRFDPLITVEQLKVAKLELITGIPTANQRITLFASEGDSNPVAQLSDDSKALGFYCTTDYQVLKVDDTNPSVSFTGQLTDVSQVNKFELSDAEYAKRTDTVLAYKQTHKVGRFADKTEPSEPLHPTPQLDIPTGARCEVESSEPGFSKRGTVRFVGPTKFGAGTGVWVGVEYDEPIGKNDGSVQGERYFTCKPKYGLFVRPEKLTVGDFPVEDLEMDLDDEEM